MDSSYRRHHLCFHGIETQIDCGIETISAGLDELLREYRAATVKSPITGELRWYDAGEVVRRLSKTAVALPTANGLELYQDDERFWIIDDAWGMAELNLLRGQWKSWILPESVADRVELVQRAVMWPLAQLMRARGLHLIPAASVMRDGFAALIICNFNIEPELAALIRAGYRVVGQSWTALRDAGERVELLSTPMPIQRVPFARSRMRQISEAGTWIDLTGEFPGSAAANAICDAVILVDTGRRPLPYHHLLAPTNALSATRRAWPIPELHPHRVQGQMPVKLSRQCGVHEMQFSHNARDVLTLMEYARRENASPRTVRELAEAVLRASVHVAKGARTAAA